MCPPATVHGPGCTVLASTRGGSSCRSVCTPWNRPGRGLRAGQDDAAGRDVEPVALAHRARGGRRRRAARRAAARGLRSVATGSGYPVEGRSSAASAFAADCAAAECRGTTMRVVLVSVNGWPGAVLIETGCGTNAGIAVVAASAAPPGTRRRGRPQVR